jgi:hemolysin activation/secretion protein
MKKLPLFFSVFLYAQTNLIPPENSSVIEKQLEELQKQQYSKSKVDKLKVEQKAKTENHLNKKIKFLLKNIKIVGDTIFDKKILIDILKPYLGKYVSSVDLKEIAKKITMLYHKKGYLTSKCIIPPQKIVNGTVTFKIIEDRLAKIIIVGKKAYSYNTNIFMRYLYDLKGKILSINELNYRLKLLSNLPATKITPILKKIKDGYSVLILKITDLKEKNYVSIDNGGSKYTGVYRINIGGNINNIRGVSDSLKINVTTVPNPKYLGAVSFSYITPFENKGAKVVFGYSDMYYQLNPDKLNNDTVIYKGGSKTFTFSYVKPVYLKFLKNYALSYAFGFEKKEVTSQTILNSTGDLLVDSKDKTFVLNAKVSYQQLDRIFKEYPAINNFRFSIKHALEGVFGSMTTEDLKRKENDNTFPITGPIKYGGYLDPSFTKYYYFISRNQKLPKDFYLFLSLNGDYSQKRVPQAYEYGGHDWGFQYKATLKKKVYKFNTSFYVSQSIVYDYDTSGNITRDVASPGVGLSINTTYKNCYFNLSYSTSFATWDSNSNNIRFLIKYSW